MSKLKNIKALNEMLTGEHRTQTRKTFGFTDTKATAERNKKREVGEIWEEKDIHGNSIWFEQADGFRIRSSVHPDIQKTLHEMRDIGKAFTSCPKEVCTCTNRTRLDELFRKKMGMCEDCVITMETSLKMKGKFEEYALNKMKANANAFFKDADTEVEVLKSALTNINFAGDETDNNNVVETWSHQNPEEFKQMIDEQYATFKTKVLERFETGRDSHRTE